LRAKSRFFWKTASTFALVVREREAGPAAAERAAGRRLAFVELGRPRHRAVLVVRVVGRLAVGDVEVRRPLRDVRVDRRVPVGARGRLEPRVVVGVDVGDVAERIEQQLCRRVVVDDRLGRDLAQQAVVRQVLRLRQRERTAIRLAPEAEAGALLVEAPRRRVVAVRVDAVLAAAVDAVAVVVAQGLAPQPVRRLAQRRVGLRCVGARTMPSAVL